MAFKVILMLADSYEGSSENLQTVSSDDIISMRFEKETYTPYSQIAGRIMLDSPIRNVHSIKLMFEDQLLHFGPPDRVEWEYKDQCGILSFSSRGYSCALGQNQLTPGIYSNVTFDELLTSNIVLPHVEYEKFNTKINYVYIKDNDTMWDAAVAYARKFCGLYPFIYGANEVRIVNIYRPTIHIFADDIISASWGQDFSHTVSHFHMKNAEGNYNTYNLTNENAVRREIIRHKHIPLDRQWLSNPGEAMQSRIDFSERGRIYTKLTYLGYNGEDLNQYVRFYTDHFQEKPRPVSRIELNISAKGPVTTLWFYNDNYHYWN